MVWSGATASTGSAGSGSRGHIAATSLHVTLPDETCLYNSSGGTYARCGATLLMSWKTAALSATGTSGWKHGLAPSTWKVGWPPLPGKKAGPLYLESRLALYLESRLAPSTWKEGWPPLPGKAGWPPLPGKHGLDLSTWTVITVREEDLVACS